ncbi:hypothetical protein RCH16_003621 [Cryobacterium sp. MP_M5]|uniref:hypothetical protein n=1 Tax=unclassified Cryobacterium TaxID=2649013 RepID=UPI0018CA6F3D|nr:MULTISPECIES: hypothetical protein [unclassified Cryobacterium]MBG6060146.1 hypothetical protein [Cryobacterium sp. MP_M3]MEC5178582.1 hypothetical protein [Cryobacterium sp. MP_M5]
MGSYTEISTLRDGIAYVRSLSADTPNLAAEVGGTARTVGDLAVTADLPWDVNNSVGSGLVSLNAAVLNDPSSAVAQLSELNLIMDKIEAAI